MPATCSGSNFWCLVASAQQCFAMPGLVQGYLAPAPASAKLSSANISCQNNSRSNFKIILNNYRQLVQCRVLSGVIWIGSRWGLLGYLAPPPPISCTLHTCSAKGGVCCNPRKILRKTFSWNWKGKIDGRWIYSEERFSSLLMIKAFKLCEQNSFSQKRWDESSCNTMMGLHLSKLEDIKWKGDGNQN